MRRQNAPLLARAHRKALDNIDLNLVSHRYVSGVLKDDHFGCIPLCQRFRKFRSEFKWRGPFRFLTTGIFGITYGGGSLISVGIFRSKFAIPFLTNRFYALIKEFVRSSAIIWKQLFLRSSAICDPRSNGNQPVLVFNHPEDGRFVRPKYRCKRKLCHLFICAL